MERQPIPLAGHGADGDVETGSASVETKEPDRTGVHAAGMRFQFIDNFHGANLGGTGDRSTGKTSPQTIHMIDVGP